MKFRKKDVSKTQRRSLIKHRWYQFLKTVYRYKLGRLIIRGFLRLRIIIKRWWKHSKLPGFLKSVYARIYANARSLISKAKQNKGKLLLITIVVLFIAAAITIMVRSYLSNPERITTDYNTAEQQATQLSSDLRILQSFSVDPSKQVARYSEQVDSLTNVVDETDVHNPGRTGLSIFLEGNPDKTFEMERLENNDLEQLRGSILSFSKGYGEVLDSLGPVFAYSASSFDNASADTDKIRHFTKATEVFSKSYSSFNDVTKNGSGNIPANNPQLQEIDEVLQRLINESRSQQQSANISLWQRAVRDYKIEIATQLNRLWGEFYSEKTRQLSEHISDYQRVQGLVKAEK